MLCSVALAAEYSPVLVFGGNGQAVPALSLVSSEQFVGIAKSDDAMNVIFVEKNAKPENFLDCTTESGETCYTGLKSIQGKTYYRQVDSPIASLKNSYGDCQILNTNTEGELITPIEFVPKSCVIVNLFGTFQASDALITKFVEANKNNNVIAIYTPNVAHVRAVRATKTAELAPEGSVLFLNQDPGFAMFYEQVQLCTYDSSTKKTTCETLKSVNLNTPSSNATSFSVSITTDKNPITFDIQLDSAGYFEMHNLAYGASKFRIQPDVNSPTTFSYFCGNVTFNQYGEDAGKNILSLKFNVLQMQAPFNSKTPVNGDFAFGDPWHCVPFVSIPILAGLFVCAILLAILGVGICWLMDINTMDRFDDPKGKTITINAGE